MKKKNFFLTKTFWINVAGIAASYGGLLPQKYAVPVLGVANLGVRLLTSQPVTLGKGD